MQIGLKIEATRPNFCGHSCLSTQRTHTHIHAIGRRKKCAFWKRQTFSRAAAKNFSLAPNWPLSGWFSWHLAWWTWLGVYGVVFDAGGWCEKTGRDAEKATIEKEATESSRFLAPGQMLFPGVTDSSWKCCLAAWEPGDRISLVCEYWIFFLHFGVMGRGERSLRGERRLLLCPEFAPTRVNGRESERECGKWRCACVGRRRDWFSGAWEMPMILLRIPDAALRRTRPWRTVRVALRDEMVCVYHPIGIGFWLLPLICGPLRKFFPKKNLPPFQGEDHPMSPIVPGARPSCAWECVVRRSLFLLPEGS